MFRLISSLHFLSITISIIFLVLPSSNGVDGKYKTCSSALFSCGNSISNVGYPFWGDGRPKYCGHPSLQLQCLNTEKGNKTLLKIGPEDDTPYDVLEMSIYYHNISLKLGMQNTPCKSYEKDFNELLFKFSPNVENITFVYNCPRDIGLHNLRGPIPCYAVSTRYDAYYLYNVSARRQYASCSSFEVPVYRNQLEFYNKWENESLTRVLSDRFEVNYQYSSECLECKKSSGVCGSSDHSDFVCLCKDGASAEVCPTKKSVKLKLILGIGIPGGILVLVGLNIGLCYYLKLRLHTSDSLSRILSTDPMTSDLEIGSTLHGIPVVPYSELQDATNNFEESRELGDGGFGIVYYGKLRDGREVAVKRLYEKNYKQVGQFLNEVEILTRLRHPNLVTLYGCTSRHSRELLLVYEYISNGTVADHLHGDRSGSRALTWAIRMKIAIETASALSYLHTSEIVHRDVKTNNILLTDNFSVKVADFGLSRLFPTDVTHVSTAPQGTPGYLDPEYHKCYQVTDKSDVYSFGVVLVELISSLPAVDISRQDDEINLSDYAMNRLQRGALYDLVDENLGYNSDFKAKRMITLVAELAFRCLQQERDLRPCMAEVLEDLVRSEGLDYGILEAEDMGEKQTSVTNDDNIRQPSPSSVIDNWAVKSTPSSHSS